MSFAIGIPTLNRGVDLLLPSLIKYATGDFKDIDIHVVDNGKQSLTFVSELTPQIHVYEQQHNIGVAGSWNMLCNKIFESHSHALILKCISGIWYTACKRCDFKISLFTCSITY